MDAHIRTNNPLSIVCVAALFLLVSNIDHAASFDCSKATKLVEKKICSNRLIGAEDEHIASAYAKLISQENDADGARIRESQRKWIQKRDIAFKAGNDEELISMMRWRSQLLSRARVDISGLHFLKLYDDTELMFLSGETAHKAYNKWVEVSIRDIFAKGWPRSSRLSPSTFHLSYVSPTILSIEERIPVGDGGKYVKVILAITIGTSTQIGLCARWIYSPTIGISRSPHLLLRSSFPKVTSWPLMSPLPTKS